MRYLSETSRKQQAGRAGPLSAPVRACGYRSRKCLEVTGCGCQSPSDVAKKVAAASARKPCRIWSRGARATGHRRRDSVCWRTKARGSFSLDDTYLLTYLYCLNGERGQSGSARRHTMLPRSRRIVSSIGCGEIAERVRISSAG